MSGITISHTVPPVNPVPISPLNAVCDALAGVAEGLAGNAARERTARSAKLAVMAMVAAEYAHLCENAVARLMDELEAAA